MIGPKIIFFHSKLTYCFHPHWCSQSSYVRLPEVWFQNYRNLYWIPIRMVQNLRYLVVQLWPNHLSSLRSIQNKTNLNKNLKSKLKLLTFYSPSHLMIYNNQYHYKRQYFLNDGIKNPRWNFITLVPITPLHFSTYYLFTP